jgi:hypothetical protein
MPGGQVTRASAADLSDAARAAIGRDAANVWPIHDVTR